MSHHNPTKHPSWIRLQGLTEEAAQEQLATLLQDHQRAGWAVAQGAGIRLDFTRQRITRPVFDQLLVLAQESGVLSKARAMFAGEPINTTEGRPVLHPALRGLGVSSPPWGDKIQTAVAEQLDRCLNFAEALRGGHLQGHSGKPLVSVVNIGIGGSDLGPRMATDAMACSTDCVPAAVHLHYVSNADGWALAHALRQCRPETTLFIIQSKTFTTQETLTIFESAKRWLLDGGCPPDKLAHHLAAVTANPSRAASAGFDPAKTFCFWDWVGGRYSVWSAIGLPFMVAVGSHAFKAFLAGGRAMDEHFLQAPPAKNIPLLMGLLGVWNRNFLRTPTHHIAAYAFGLQRFTAFVQQMDMESNGKSVHTDGSACSVLTGPIVWGGLGIDGQHAYFQLLHQGMHPSAIDFIGVESLEAPLPLGDQHAHVVDINFRAQQDALALGRSLAQTHAMLLDEGLGPAEADRLAPHRVFAGNTPSSSITVEKLSPQALGALVAAYEHKVFAQACIWNINAFDQWGVELGKTMARALETGNTLANGQR